MINQVFIVCLGSGDICPLSTCNDSQAVFFSVTSDPHKLLAQVMSYVCVIVDKQAHRLVQ